MVLDAHRCGAGEERENSISGAERVLATGTVHVLDVDSRPLADGTPVLMHDLDVARTTDHEGRVSDYTPETWRDVMLDTGDGQPEPAPTFEAFLDAVAGRAVITVEAKDPAGVPRLAAIIRDRRLERSVMINTNDPAVAMGIHKLGLLTHLWRSGRQMAHDDPRAWARYVDLLDVDVNATDGQILEAAESGIGRVWAHSVVTAEQRDRVLRLGVTGIITDYPLTLDQR